jgi:dienelactone hydrolase
MPFDWTTRRVGDVPLLLATPSDAPRPIPAVLWFHGLNVDKETHRAELERIARCGWLAVGVDAAGHGERRLPDLEQRIAGTQAEALQAMLPLIDQTAEEVPAVVRALVDDGLADAERIAIVGTSMGGFVVYRTLLTDVPLCAAVSLLGSPEWPRDDSPHRHLDAFRRTALLSINGETDNRVPPGPARDLHRRLAESGLPPERARYVEFSGAEHLMSADDWERAMEETLRWLATHLR